ARAADALRREGDSRRRRRDPVRDRALGARAHCGAIQPGPFGGDHARTRGKAWKAAQILAHSRPVSMYMWNGVGQHTNATQTSRAISSLYALIGDIDRAGGNVVFPKPKMNGVEGREF